MSSTVDPGAEPAAAEDPSDRRRRALKRSVADMVRSMLVVVGVVAVIVLLVPRPNATPQRAVDVATVARGAQQDLGFAPAVPVGLPAGWTATSADVRNSADGITTWHIGYLTSDGHYASVEQAAKVTRRWEEIMDSGGLPREPQIIDGTTWEQRYKDVRDVYALIHRGEERTTMITSKGGGLANADVLARSIPASQR